MRRPSESVPTKMPTATANTTRWPNIAPEQPAAAMGAIAARYQGVSFILVEISEGRRRGADRTPYM
jgi:hypothetical protein